MVQGILGIVVLIQLFIVALMMQLFIDGCVVSGLCWFEVCCGRGWMWWVSGEWY